MGIFGGYELIIIPIGVLILLTLIGFVVACERHE